MPIIIIFANLWGMVGVWLSYPVVELLIIMMMAGYYLVGLFKPGRSV